MERAAWLKRMRSMAEALYDRLSPQYWVTFGLEIEPAHQAFLQKFLGRLPQPGVILSASCGAGRNDGVLLAAGHAVVGIDQSEGMLARAREHFPAARYEKMGLQEMNFREAFDGVTCIDALEHVCPEDYPGIIRNFQAALKPGGVLYFTVDVTPEEDLKSHYRQAQALGLPVVYGEVVDRIEESFERIQASDQPASSDLSDQAVYHFYPRLEQVRAWIAQAGLDLLEEGDGDGYHHFIALKKQA